MLRMVVPQRVVTMRSKMLSNLVLCQVCKLGLIGRKRAIRGVAAAQWVYRNNGQL